MAITIYEDKKFKGDKRTISRDDDDLKGNVDKPSSIKMSSSSDKILMFKNDDWKGGTLYLRGPCEIGNLGSSKEGGRRTYGNSIRSVRVTPFRIDLNVTIVKNSDGDLPGRWTSVSDAKAKVREIVKLANDWYKDERALLTLKIDTITVRESDKYFSLGNLASFPRSWKKRGLLDLIFIDHFASGKMIGQAPFPCTGQMVRVAATHRDKDSGKVTHYDTDNMANVTVHEIGHYLGLLHSSSKGDTNNIMTAKALVRLKDAHLTQDQIRTMHQKLARNISRKGDRN